MQFMPQKRKRDITGDDAVAKERDSPVVQEVLRTFGGAWTPDHWRAALTSDAVTSTQLESMIAILKMKNQSSHQVAMLILDTFPSMVALQDFAASRNVYLFRIPA